MSDTNGEEFDWDAAAAEVASENEVPELLAEMNSLATSGGGGYLQPLTVGVRYEHHGPSRLEFVGVWGFLLLFSAVALIVAVRFVIEGSAFSNEIAEDVIAQFLEVGDWLSDRWNDANESRR